MVVCSDAVSPAQTRQAPRRKHTKSTRLENKWGRRGLSGHAVANEYTGPSRLTLFLEEARTGTPLKAPRRRIALGPPATHPLGRHCKSLSPSVMLVNCNFGNVCPSLRFCRVSSSSEVNSSRTETKDTRISQPFRREEPVNQVQTNSPIEPTNNSSGGAKAPPAPPSNLGFVACCQRINRHCHVARCLNSPYFPRHNWPLKPVPLPTVSSILVPVMGGEDILTVRQDTQSSYQSRQAATKGR